MTANTRVLYIVVGFLVGTSLHLLIITGRLQSRVALLTEFMHVQMQLDRSMVNALEQRTDIDAKMLELLDLAAPARR